VIAEMAMATKEAGCRVRVTDETGAIVVLIGVATAQLQSRRPHKIVGPKITQGKWRDPSDFASPLTTSALVRFRSDSGICSAMTYDRANFLEGTLGLRAPDERSRASEGAPV
jgi:hypothetical protein